MRIRPARTLLALAVLAVAALVAGVLLKAVAVAIAAAGIYVFAACRVRRACRGPRRRSARYRVTTLTAQPE